LVDGRGSEVVSSGLVEAAHRAGLLVHPYTVRSDSLPAWAPSVERLQSFLIDDLKVDGFFTDFPDLGRRAVDR
jgi:glycerophosphoryl diester phosphodiesterase